MPIDLATAKSMLEKWLEADAAVALNQEYVVAGTRVTKADSRMIGKRIDHWRSVISRLEDGGDGSIRCHSVVVIDG